MGYADLHIHSIYSRNGTSTIPAILKFTADHTDLDVIAITDHDSLRGNREAIQLAPRYGLEVIPGCEVSTADGHLLALFIEKPIPAGLTLVESVLRVGDQGGVCVVPHLTALGTSSVSLATLKKALTFPAVSISLVGIEIFNGGLVYTRSNHTLRTMKQTFSLAQVGNSDAHILPMIGQGSTVFPGTSALDLRTALESRTTIVQEACRLTGIRVIKEWVPRFFLRKLGWVSWNAGPDDPLTLVRVDQAVSS